MARIAQVNRATEYFLGDAQGLVRQLVSQSGAITYASSHDPYTFTKVHPDHGPFHHSGLRKRYNESEHGSSACLRSCERNC